VGRSIATTFESLLTFSGQMDAYLLLAPPQGRVVTAPSLQPAGRDRGERWSEEEHRQPFQGRSIRARASLSQLQVNLMLIMKDVRGKEHQR
jgi:hypothetical protein